MLIFSGFLLVSIFLTKISDNLGVPSLILFILIGILAGNDGPGQINFNDYKLTQNIGFIALIFILFSGGLDTKWKSIKTVFWSGFSLSTLGILIVTLVTGMFCYYILKLPLITSLLLGAIISSTDAAAVFSVLNAKGTRLKGKVRPLLEFESGINDPLAVFLTIALIEINLTGVFNIFEISLNLIFQFAVGIIIAIISAKLFVYVLNSIKFSNNSLYIVLTIAFSLLIYGATTVLKGSGILAVYISALIISKSDFIQKKSICRFFEGLALLSQIVMFLTLGLLSTPTQLFPVINQGLIISIFLIIAARPISVFISLLFSNFSIREKVFVSWVGLRGAVPIILATIPVIAGVDYSTLIFNLIFFITVSSALIQGWSIPLVSKLLKIEEPDIKGIKMPIEMSGSVKSNKELIDIIIPYNSTITGKSLAELSLPESSLIVLISRNGEFVVPNGSSSLEEGDTLLVLSDKENIKEVKNILMKVK